MPEGFSHVTKTNAALDERVKSKKKKVRVKVKPPVARTPVRVSDSADTQRRKPEVDRQIEKDRSKKPRPTRGRSSRPVRTFPKTSKKESFDFGGALDVFQGALLAADPIYQGAVLAENLPGMPELSRYTPRGFIAGDRGRRVARQRVLPWTMGHHLSEPGYRGGFTGEFGELAFLGLGTAASPLRAGRAATMGIVGFKSGGLKGAGRAAGQALTDEGRGLVNKGVRRASSRAAGVAADALDRTGAKGLADFVRNSPDSKRWFSNGDSMIWVDPAKSRTGKLAEKAYDAARPLLSAGPTIKGRRVALAKTEQEKWAQALETKHHEAWKQAQMSLVQIDAALSHGVVNRYFKRLSVPDFYALRMVGKGVDPETMVTRFRGLADEARAAGDTSKAARLDFHAGMAAKAAPLVALRGGDVVFSELSSRKLRTVYEYIERAGRNREDIYANLDLLTQANAEARKTNEELWHYGAVWQPTERFIEKRLADSPNRQALYEIAKSKNPEAADDVIAAIDGLARSWMDQRMQNMADGIRRMSEEVRTSRDPQKAVLLKRLTAEYKRGVDPDSYYRQWKETLTEIPDDALGLSEIAPFHAFTEERAKKNLWTKMNPKNKGKGVPVNKRIFRTVNGQRIVVAGDVTPAQWVKRVQTLMPSQEDRHAWSQWYDEFEPMFRTIFGEDADALMRGFAVSQANASPATGLRAVFKIMEALSRGEKVEKGYGSVVAASIAKAVDGGEIDKGVAAKLSDFIDSLMLSPTRTWMGNAAEGGRPVAVDVHAARDRGFIDRKMRLDARASGRQGLESRFGLIEGKHYVVDNLAGSPSGVNYERTAEWYERLTDHLNKIEFDGRTDWEPRQVQALGWATVQLLHGADPQDFAHALSQNTRRVSFEVTQGPGDLGADLTPTQAGVVAKALEPEMRRLVEESGGYLNGVTHSVDGWAGGTNAAVHLDVIGTEDAVQKMLTLTAQAFDQGLVQGTRTVTGANSRAALVMSSPDFADESVRTAFIKRVYELSPKLAEHGYMADTFQNAPGIKIVTSRRSIGPKGIQKFLDQYKDAIDQAEAEMGIDVSYGLKNTEIKIGDQVGEASYDATAGRAGSLDDLHPVALAIRERLVALIDEVRTTHPADAEEVAARDLARDRAAYDSLIEEAARAKGAKRLTDAQRAATEEESLKLADRYPDEEWSQEFHRLRSSLGLDEATSPDPEDLFARGADEASGGSRSPADVSAGDSRTAFDADAGRSLVRHTKGYKEAADDLRRGTLPVEWLKALVKKGEKLHVYDKYRIGAHLDELVREGGGASIIGHKFESVPGLEEFLTETKIKGMYRGPASQLIVTEHGNVPTIFHELTHMAHDKGLFPPKLWDDVKEFLGVQGDSWTETQMEGLADIMEATLLGFDPELTKGLSEAAQRMLGTVRKEFLKADPKRAKAMMRKLDDAGPLGVRINDALLNLFDAAPKRGNRFHGASTEFRDRAKVYMPETLGLPSSYGRDLFALRSYAARLGGLVGSKSNILPGDKALSHEFTAHLLESGAFDKNIIKGTIQSQMKAARIHAMAVIRDEARKIGKAVPESADDIAIPADTLRFQGDAGKDIDFVAGMLHSIEEGKVISEAELSRFDMDALTQAADVLFPGATKATEAETRKLAEEILSGVREPIEGVLWVNRQDLLNTAAFNTRSKSGALRLAAGVNDYLKALLLTLKPSYIPMNFIGNTAMGLMQQGAFAPLNYAKAWRLNQSLGDDAVLVDFFAGAGAMQSIFGPKGGVPVVSGVLDKVTEVSGWLVDRHWRRAAFLYEARKLGYRNADDLRALLKDPANVDDLYTVSKRTKNAMVDFENLSTFEKDVMANAMFVYPWFKGATYWTGNFVKDHPLQASVYAYLLAQQQQRLEEALPEGRPGYLKWYLPVGTTERDGQEMPFGMRLDQALTFLTPADLAADAAAFASGGRVSMFGEAEPEAMASKLNPLYEELLKTITGYDSFTGQPVDQGVPDLLMRLLPSERSVAWQQVLSILDEGKRNRSMYHPTEGEAWLKLFFGSLAPGAVDPVKAGERAKGLRQTRTDEENLDLWAAKAERAFGEAPPDWLVEYKRTQQRYNDLEGDYEAELGYPEGGMTRQERTVVLFRLLAEKEGTTWNREDEILALDDDTIDDIYSDLRRDLGLTQIDAFDRDIGEKRKEQRVSG